jgi:hypothetical protein
LKLLDYWRCVPGLAALCHAKTSSLILFSFPDIPAHSGKL